MSECIVVVGAQWGDEGKGKIVDSLTEKASAVVRFQGGHNAGHTLYRKGKPIILRLVPSGILHPVNCYIGNGVVVSLTELAQELEELRTLGIPVTDRLKISQLCHLLLPYHVQLDKVREKKLAAKAIGTTKRGIGPAYEDKVARRGIRISDFSDTKQFAEKVKIVADYHNFMLTHYYKSNPVDVHEIIETQLQIAEQLQPLFADVSSCLIQHIGDQESIIFEGAQGSMLDIDHGTYPFVTSSNTVAGTAAVGSGIGLRYFTKVLGVAKAYLTRVGEGPFPSELQDDTGQYLAKQGREFGSVTGRARRCGWFDIVALRRSITVNGLQSLCLTKLDVLDGLPELKIAIDYTADGEPVYVSQRGWQATTKGVHTWDALPPEARAYVECLERLAGIPIDLISTGSKYADIITRMPLLK